MRRVVVIGGVGSAFGLVINGWAWVLIMPLALAVAALMLFIGWQCFEPERERAHARYTTRVSSRPRPASQWAKDDDPLPPVQPADRADIVARPGRRMIALLDDDAEQVNR